MQKRSNHAKFQSSKLKTRGTAPACGNGVPTIRKGRGFSFAFESSVTFGAVEIDQRIIIPRASKKNKSSIVRDRSKARGMRKYRLFGGVFLTLVTFLLLAIALSRNPRRPDFLDSTRAGSFSNLFAIASQLIGDLNATNRAEYFAQNRVTLEAARKSIEKPMESPEASYQVGNFDIMRLGQTKRLALALVAEGQVAEEDKRYRAAADIYFDTIRMGERVEHGPLINYLVGAAIERSALKQLEPLLPKLSTADLADLAPKLQTFNRDRIPFDEILRREHYFMSVNATNIVDAVKTRFSSRTGAMVNKTRESHSRLRVQIEIVAATMGALRYTRENPTPLTNVEFLAPKYLRSVPLDPYSNRPLLVLNTTNTPIVYSVGPNKRDDHAKSDDILPGFRDNTASRIMLNAITSQ